MKRSYLENCLRLAAAALALLAAAPTQAALSTPPTTGSSAATSSSDAAISYFGANESLDRSGVFKVQEYITVQPGTNPPDSVTQRIAISTNDDQGNTFPSEFKILGATINGHAATGLKNSTNGSLATITFPLEKISGKQKFAFEYSLSPVILAGQDADVFKVSATGLDWSLPITPPAILTIKTPNLNPKDLTCYTGAGGSTTSNCRITPTGPGANIITTDAVLNPGDSLTLFAGFPRHSFTAYYNSWHIGLLLPWAGGAGIAIIGVIALAIVLRQRRSRHSHNASSSDS